MVINHPAFSYVFSIHLPHSIIILEWSREEGITLLLLLQAQELLQGS
jgi:hypothetical protein